MAADALIGRALLSVDLLKGNLGAKFNGQLRQIEQVGGAGGSVLGGIFSAAFGAAEIGVTALGAAALTAAGYGVRLAMSFDQAMLLVHTQAGYTEDDLARLRGPVLALSQQFGISATDLANGLYRIASSAIPPSQALQVLTTSAMLAKTGNADLETTTNALAAALKAYGATGADAQRIADVLNTTVGTGNMRMQDLASSIGLVLPMAAKLNVPLEQVGANLAVMTQKGVNTAEAVTALNGLLSALAAPSHQAKTALADIGLTSADVRKMIGSEGLAGTIMELDRRTHGNIDSLKAIIPNIRALRDQLGVTGASAKDYAAALDAMNHSHDKGKDLTAMWADAQKDASVQTDKAREKMNAAAIVFGEKLLPYVVAAAPVVADLATKGFAVLGAIVDRLPAMFNALAGGLRSAQQMGQNFEANMRRWMPVLAPIGGFLVAFFTPAIIGFAVATGVQAVQAVVGFVASMAAQAAAFIENLFYYNAVNAQLVVYYARQVAANVITGIRTVATWAQSTALTAWTLIQERGILGTIAYVTWSTLAKAATALWTAVQWLLNAAFSANPVGLVVIAIAALVAIVVYAYQHNEKFRQIVNALWADLKRFGDWLVSELTPIFKQIGQGAQELGNALNSINPFAKHSPSLVENVQAGTAVIAKHYGAMAASIKASAGDARGAMDDMAAGGMGGAAGPGGGAAGGAGGLGPAGATAGGLGRALRLLEIMNTNIQQMTNDICTIANEGQPPAGQLAAQRTGTAT